MSDRCQNWQRLLIVYIFCRELQTAHVKATTVHSIGSSVYLETSVRHATLAPQLDKSVPHSQQLQQLTSHNAEAGKQPSFRAEVRLRLWSLALLLNNSKAWHVSRHASNQKTHFTTV
jgi:hypothetical protein